MSFVQPERGNRKYMRGAHVNQTVRTVGRGGSEMSLVCSVSEMSLVCSVRPGRNIFDSVVSSIGDLSYS